MGYYSKEQGSYISNGIVNKTIADWQAKQPNRVITCASPSSLMDCPRVVWLRKHQVPSTNPLGWGKKQRFALGRIIENYIAQQMDDEGILLHHWKDDFEGESDKFSHGEVIDKLEGTPDLLIQIGDEVAISDSKTSRSDSFNYVPIQDEELWKDPYYYKYKLQLTAYFMLAHWNKGWFERTLLADQPETRKFGEGPATLPLPDICHLFVYALDDGIVRRDVTWKPEKADMEEVNRLTKRWNSAYMSDTMPECTCIGDDSVKFCYYGIQAEGDKICKTCCNDKLGDL